MKKLFLLLIIAFLFCACYKKNAVQNIAVNKNKINIIASIFPAFDFARIVAGDKAVVEMLLPPAMESHSYEPSPRDIINIQKSDLFIYIGGESESWVKHILESIDGKNVKTKMLALIDSVDAVEEKSVEGMETDNEETSVYDEHIWTSPKNAAFMIRAIFEALREIDEKNTESYFKNADNYVNRLAELDAEFRELVNGAKIKTLVFGGRFPFRYFADEYGLDYYAAFPGCANEMEPSAATIAFLINKIKAENIKAVFYIELSNEKIADAIVEAAGVKKLLLHSAHNITKKDFENGVTYIDLLQTNLISLKEGLQ